MPGLCCTVSGTVTVSPGCALISAAAIRGVLSSAADVSNHVPEGPDISQEMLGERLGISRRVVQRYINTLKGTGRIERIGGKRFGYWKVN